MRPEPGLTPAHASQLAGPRSAMQQAQDQKKRSPRRPPNCCTQRCGPRHVRATTGVTAPGRAWCYRSVSLVSTLTSAVRPRYHRCRETTLPVASLRRSPHRGATAAGRASLAHRGGAAYRRPCARTGCWRGVTAAARRPLCVAGPSWCFWLLLPRSTFPRCHTMKPFLPLLNEAVNSNEIHCPMCEPTPHHGASPTSEQSRASAEHYSVKTTRPHI